MILAGISWLWTNPTSYNFSSSEWGGMVFKLFYAIVFIVVVRWLFKPLMRRIHEHMECDVQGCSRWGRLVHGTSHRACKEHHPHLKEEGHTPTEIEKAAKFGHRYDD